MTRTPRAFRMATPLLLLFTSALALPATPAPPEGGRLDDATRSALLAEVARTLETAYVDAEAGRRLAAEIRRRAHSRSYDGLSSAPEFAARMTRELQELGKDKHLAVLEESRHGATVQRVERGGEEGSGGTPERRVVRRHGGMGGPEAQRWKRANHGVDAAQRLEGNVGYLRVSGFPSGEGARGAIAGAMGLLAGTDSLVVDVRECPGGSPDSVTFLSSYFFGPEPVELLSRYDRRADETEKDFTLRELPGARRPDTDLRILTSANTGSACESFAYILQQHRRARVVGERTAGAGHLAARFPLGTGLVMSVSVGRPIHPLTGRGWEGTGVVPDADAPAASALAVAHEEAVAALRERSTDATERRRLAWALDAAKARRAAAPPPLRGSYAGTYGEREITLGADGLRYRGPGGRTWGPLAAVGPDVFAIDEEARLRFERSAAGEITALTLERIDGSAERAAKGPAGSREQVPRGARPVASRAATPASIRPAAAGPAADAAVLPDTPAGRRAAAFFEAVRGAETEKVRGIIAANWSDGALGEVPANERATRLAGLARNHPNLRPRRLLASEASRVAVLGEDGNGEWLEVTVVVEAEAPHKIVGVTLDRSARDAAPREAAKGSDAEVARAVDAYLRGLADADEFSGVVLLARRGAPFLQKAYGLADRERRTPNTPETRFNIGSIQKTITQIAVAQLAEEGKLTLSDTVRKHLPDYPSPAADRITIQHLVTMTSGLGDIFGAGYAAADKTRIRKLSDYLPFFVDAPLRFEPGQGREYSNAGYVVLGLIVEKLTGRDYHDAVREAILTPAGMTRSGALDPRSASGIAMGYTRRLPGTGANGDRVPNTAALPGRASSAGGTYATAGDLLKLGEALRADRLVSRGWGDWIFSDKGQAPGEGRERSGAFGVAGGIPGANGILEMDLDGGATVIVLANLDPPVAEKAGRKIREWLGL